MSKPREPRPSEMLRGAHIAAAQEGCPSRGIGHPPLKAPDVLPSAAASPLAHGMGRALLELSDGHRQPIVGFGTYKVGKLPPGTVEKKAKHKIDTLLERAEAQQAEAQRYPVHFVSTEGFGTRYQKIAQLDERKMASMSSEEFGKREFYQYKVIDAVAPRSPEDIDDTLPGWRCRFEEDLSARKSSNWQHSDRSTVATFVVSSAITTGTEVAIELPKPWRFEKEKPDDEPPVVVVHAPVCSTEAGLRVEFRVATPTAAMPDSHFLRGTFAFEASNTNDRDSVKRAKENNEGRRAAVIEKDTEVKLQIFSVVPPPDEFQKDDDVEARCKGSKKHYRGVIVDDKPDSATYVIEFEDDDTEKGPSAARERERDPAVPIGSIRRAAAKVTLQLANGKESKCRADLAAPSGGAQIGLFLTARDRETTLYAGGKQRAALEKMRSRAFAHELIQLALHPESFDEGDELFFCAGEDQARKEREVRDVLKEMDMRRRRELVSGKQGDANMDTLETCLEIAHVYDVLREEVGEKVDWGEDDGDIVVAGALSQHVIAKAIAEQRGQSHEEAVTEVVEAVKLIQGELIEAIVDRCCYTPDMDEARLGPGLVKELGYDLLSRKRDIVTDVVKGAVLKYLHPQGNKKGIPDMDDEDESKEGTLDEDDIRTAEVVKAALMVGYRFLDCAKFYANERGVGRAIQESGIPRSELFIQTKVWCDAISSTGFSGKRDDSIEHRVARYKQRPAKNYGEAIRRQVRKSCRDLNVDFLDCVLLHWPVPGRFIDAYRVLEELQREKEVRSIGLSNFTIEDYNELLPHIEIPPVINQIEVNPLLWREKTVRFFQERGIAVQAYRALCDGAAFHTREFSTVAAKHRRTIAQVLGRWCLQKGVSVLLKSEQLDRMVENANIFDFELDSDDMRILDGLTTSTRRQQFAKAYRQGCVRDAMDSPEGGGAMKLERARLAFELH